MRERDNRQQEIKGMSERAREQESKRVREYESERNVKRREHADRREIGKKLNFVKSSSILALGTSAFVIQIISIFDTNCNCNCTRSKVIG